MKLHPLLVATLLLAVPAFAQAPESRPAADAVGVWRGAVKVPGPALKVVVILDRKDGVWSGSIDIPAQKADDLPLDDFAVEGVDVRFRIADIPGAPTFTGRVSEDGRTLAGKFKQSGATFPFSLERDDAAAKAGAGAGTGADSRPAEFDPDRFAAWCESARAAWRAPGLSVAVIRKNKPDFVRGFGLRDVEAGKAAGKDTLFAIGSSTKAFTAFVLATLAAEGTLDFDRPLAESLPTFRLKDVERARRVTIRDLLTHASGLPRHDLAWYGDKTRTRAELFQAFGRMDASYDLRARWQYNNFGYLTAGYAAEVLTGKTWETLVRERIFAPLGMTRADTSIVDLAADPDSAKGYGEKDKKPVLRPYRSLDAVGPAGSVNASAAEMAKWLELHLSGGKIGTRRLLSEAATADLHRPVMLMGAPGEDPETVPLGYACGWFVQLYRGRRMIEHGGNIDGFTASVAFFPEEGFGVVALANQDSSPLPMLVVKHAADAILRTEPRDWSGEAARLRDAALAAQKSAPPKTKAYRREGTRPSREPAEFAGEYADDAYGTAIVTVKGDGLFIDLHGLQAPFAHHHFDVYVGKEGGEEVFVDMKAKFTSDFDGEVDALVLPLEPAVAPIVFARRPDVRLSDPAYLARFVGRYAMGPQRAEVTVEGTTLYLDVKGQPRYALEPKRGDAFALKGMTGFSVRFGPAGADAATTATFYQPNGVFEMKRASGD